MSEQFADLGSVNLCYETFGDPSDRPLLLVMGLGTQMVAWRDEFCNDLAGKGFHVIRYDNRDCGKSTSFSAPPPTTVEIFTRRPRALDYTLADMAGDAVGLLDHLGIDRAHVVGASMGGMIAQHLGFSHPERVLSLVSIMSSTGHRLLGQPSLAVMPLFLARPSGGKQEYIERAVKLFHAVGSKKFFDEQNVREIAELGWERGVNLAGTGRQLAAIVADGNRTRRLRRISAPTLVIHGNDDKLVAPSGGRATARAIPGAKLMKVEHMGHDMPRQVWPQLIGAIAANAERAKDREVVASPAT
jgi:pimeloyl-ACP methyl ester carboxylesterase